MLNKNRIIDTFGIVVSKILLSNLKIDSINFIVSIKYNQEIYLFSSKELSVVLSNQLYSSKIIYQTLDHLYYNSNEQIKHENNQNFNYKIVKNKHKSNIFDLLLNNVNVEESLCLNFNDDNLTMYLLIMLEKNDSHNIIERIEKIIKDLNYELIINFYKYYTKIEEERNLIYRNIYNDFNYIDTYEDLNEKIKISINQNYNHNCFIFCGVYKNDKFIFYLNNKVIEISKRLSNFILDYEQNIIHTNLNSYEPLFEELFMEFKKSINFIIIPSKLSIYVISKNEDILGLLFIINFKNEQLNYNFINKLTIFYRSILNNLNYIVSFNQLTSNISTLLNHRSFLLMNFNSIETVVSYIQGMFTESNFNTMAIIYLELKDGNFENLHCIFNSSIDEYLKINIRNISKNLLSLLKHKHKIEYNLDYEDIYNQINIEFHELKNFEIDIKLIPFKDKIISISIFINPYKHNENINYENKLLFVYIYNILVHFYSSLEYNSLNNKLLEIQEELQKYKSVYVNNAFTNNQSTKLNMFSDIIGSSQFTDKLKKQLYTLSKTDVTVLIQGETGTGKELIAENIHKNSLRYDKIFIKVNCAAIPSNLLESEFFGFQKGSFTGALKDTKGKFELANNGTILLDEIGDMNLDLQSKLLRVLENMEITPVGSSKVINLDVRVIASTNNDLLDKVKKGLFREDLYYRLCVFPIKIEPIRKRKNDINLLLNYFVDFYSKKYNKNIQSIRQDALDKAIMYDWPGNVREIKNTVERSIIYETSSILKNIDIQYSDRFDNDDSDRSYEITTLDNHTKKYIEYVLQVTNGKIKGKDGAAQLLGMKPTTLYSKKKKLGIE